MSSEIWPFKLSARKVTINKESDMAWPARTGNNEQ